MITVATPAIRALHARADSLHAFESRFFWHARTWGPLAGLSGLWMVWRDQLWGRFADPHFWWMHAMAALWTLFMAMLFVIEPLFLHNRFLTSPAAAADFDRLETMYRVLLTLLALTIPGAALGTRCVL